MRVLLLMVFAVACSSCESGQVVDSAELAVVEQESAAVADDVAEPTPGALASFRATVVLRRFNEATDPEDADGDGYAADTDLDDENPWLYPGADEIRCNEVDEDGDGADLCPPDGDGDGAWADVDCDDLDPGRHPHASEEGCDGIDQNCDGMDGCDADDDGVIDELDLDPDDPDLTIERAPLSGPSY